MFQKMREGRRIFKMRAECGNARKMRGKSRQMRVTWKVCIKTLDFQIWIPHGPVMNLFSRESCKSSIFNEQKWTLHKKAAECFFIFLRDDWASFFYVSENETIKYNGSLHSNCIFTILSCVLKPYLYRVRLYTSLKMQPLLILFRPAKSFQKSSKVKLIATYLEYILKAFCRKRFTIEAIKIFVKEFLYMIRPKID